MKRGRNSLSLTTSVQVSGDVTLLQPFELGGLPPFHKLRDAADNADTNSLSSSSVQAPASACFHAELRARALEEQLRLTQAQLVAAAAAAQEAQAAVAKLLEPPDEFFDNVFDCLVMEDPVFAMDGFTYERHSIEQWLQSNSR
jgi:hypothetical protein